MSKTLFKRAAATGATFIAIGSAGAMSLPAVSNAATTHPAASSAYAIRTCPPIVDGVSCHTHGPLPQ